MRGRCILDSGEILLSLRFDRSLAPKELGVSDDVRKLGVMLREFSLTPATASDQPS